MFFHPIRKPVARTQSITTIVAGVLGRFLTVSAALIGLGTGQALAGNFYSTSAIQTKPFTPNAQLNRYWMFMDSTITTSSGSFSTADHGYVGAGSWLQMNSGSDSFKTPLRIRGSVLGSGSNGYFYDSILVNSNFDVNQGFISAKGIAQIAGSMRTGNPFADSAKTWVGGIDTISQNGTFTNTLNVKGTVNFFQNPVKNFGTLNLAGSAGSLIGGGNASFPLVVGTNINYNQTIILPVTFPALFDSTQLPGYNISGLDDATINALGPRTPVIGATYPFTTCGGPVVCNAVPAHTVNGVNLPAGQMLPPGYYGPLTTVNDVVYLGEGVYYFDQVNLNNSGSKLIALQPNGGRTIIFTRNGFATNSGGIFVGPDAAVGAIGYGVGTGYFLGGTLMIVAGSHSTIHLDSDTKIWATLSSPTGRIEVNSQVTLFGQMFGRHFNGASSSNNFSGGLGAFVPFDPSVPIIKINKGSDITTKEGPGLPGCTMPSGSFPFLATPACRDTIIYVTISSANAYPVSFSYKIVDGTAVNAANWNSSNPFPPAYSGAVSSSLTIPAGSTQVALSFKIIDNTIYQGSVNFKIALFNPKFARFDTTGGSDSLSDTVKVTILDDEVGGLVSFIRDTSSVPENTPVTDSLWLKLTDPKTGSPVTFGSADTVWFDTLVRGANPAYDPTNFVVPHLVGGSPGSYVVIRPGVSTFAIPVTIVNDGIYGPDLTFRLKLRKVSLGAIGSQDSTTVTIRNINPAPMISVDNPPGVLEGAVDSFTVSLSSPSSIPACFNWTTADSTALVGKDYTSALGTGVCIQPGSLSVKVGVQTLSDSIFEYTEYFKVLLSPVSGITAAGSDTLGVGTILNATPRPGLSIDDTSIVRPKSGFQTMTFVVSLIDSTTRRMPTPSGVSTIFAWSTVAGSALADTDFTMATGTDTILAGSVTDTIRIQIKGDPRYNPPLTFTVNLVVPAMVSANASRLNGTGTIYSAIGRPMVSVASASLSEGDVGNKPFPFLVTLLDSADGTTPVVSRVPISFGWSSVDSSATQKVDYVASLADSSVVPAGASQTSFVPDSILGNLIHQNNRIFTLKITTSDPNAQPGMSSVLGTILDDDPAPLVYIDSVTASRDTIRGSTTPHYFHVHLVDPRTNLPTTSGLPVTFGWHTVDSTAVAGLDFVGANGKDAISIGHSIDSFPVQILGDDRYAPTNAFKVVLDALSGGTFGQNVGIGTIVGGARKPVLSIMGTSIVRPKIAGDLAPLPFAYYLTDPLTGKQVPSRAKVFFYWSTFDSTAKAGIDYETVTNLYTNLGPNLLNDSLYVSVIGSGSYLPPRQVGVHLSRIDTTFVSSVATNWSALGWIIDLFTPVGSFVTGDTAVPENVAGGIVQVVVHLSGKVGSTVSLPIVVDSTSTTAKLGINYQLLDSLAVFPAGDTLDTIRLKVIQDNVYSDTLRVRLSLRPDASSGIGVVNPSAITVSILNSDAPPLISFQDTLVQVREGDTTISVVLLLDKLSYKQVVGSVGAVGGSAVAGVNYKLASGGFSFPPMTTRAVVPLQLMDDHRYGPDRDLVLSWISVQDSTSSRFDPVHDQERILIRDSGPRPVLGFQKDSIVVQDVARGLDAAVELSALSDSVALASIFFDTFRGAASGIGLVADSGYTVTIDTARKEVVFHMPFIDDGKVGPDRIVHLVLRKSLGASIGKDSVLTIVIRNTNKLPVVAIATPVDSSRTSNPIARIDWTVNGVPQPLSDTVLVEGWNTITKCYSDSALNTGCDTHHVWADFTPPVVHVFKITGPDTHDPSKDTTWWGDKARTRFGTDTVWYWVRDSILAPGGIWSVKADTHSVATKFQGDNLFPVPVGACDSVGNCGYDTGWIDLKQSLPVVKILTPPTGSHVVEGLVPVLFQVTDAGKTWQNSGSTLANQPGQLTISRCYTDDVGNTGCDTHWVVIEPVHVLTSVYVDLNGDGMVDAAIVTLDSRWVGSTLPSFNFTLNDSIRTGQKPDSAHPFYSGPSRGTLRIVGTDSFWVEAGPYLKDSTGKTLSGPDGKPLTNILGDTARDADGSVMRDSLGRVLYKVAGPGQLDSTRLLVPIVPPFGFGQTGFDTAQKAEMILKWSVQDSAGKLSTYKLVDTFGVGDQVPPVILAAVIHRVENYTDPDTLFVTPSEPIDLSTGKDWLEVWRCSGQRTSCDSTQMAWVKVPADSVHKNTDGTYWFLVPPGDTGSISPNYKVRFSSGVSDTLNNATDPSNIHWATTVTGLPRPPLVRVTAPSLVPTIPISEENRTAPGAILLKVTKGKSDGSSKSMQWWQPGIGYVAEHDACNNESWCNGPTMEINRPARMILYIYDRMGTFVTSRDISITQADLDAMQRDQLDRVSIQFDWNHRTNEGHLVASGIYLWRIVSYIQVPGRAIPIMNNQLVRVGVQVR